MVQTERTPLTRLVHQTAEMNHPIQLHRQKMRHTHTKCAAMGSKGIQGKVQSKVAEVERLNEELSTDCPDSDSDNDMAVPCISDTEDETMVDTEYKQQKMDKALPGWTQWQAHIEGHCAPREEISPPNIQQASTIEALDTTVDTLTPEMDSDLLHPPGKDRPVSERRHWRKMRREISMMDKSGKLTIQRHRRKNERRRFYPFCALVARPV